MVLARGGSKGIPKKNLVNFLGKPLVAWTIECALGAECISSVWVSSDDDEILKVAEDLGAKKLKRPVDISNDIASSEAGWLHALDHLVMLGETVDLVVAPQCTSPVRESTDFDRAIQLVLEDGYDSLFSACNIPDFNIWRRRDDQRLDSINYDYQRRERRQEKPDQYLENGSFYIFKPEILRTYQNRLGGNIGQYSMPIWKSFQIDEQEDLEFCELLMKSYLLRG